MINFFCIVNTYHTSGMSSIHGKNMEFGHLILGKLCFWRDIIAILRGHSSFNLDGNVCLFLTKISEICKIFHIFDNIFDHIPVKFCIFSSLSEETTELFLGNVILKNVSTFCPCHIIESDNLSNNNKKLKHVSGIFYVLRNLENYNTNKFLVFL